MKLFGEIHKFSQSKEGKYRLKILEFFEQYGLSATKSAFGVSKATLYRWRKMYLDMQKNPLALIPKSREPKHKRVMRTNPKIIEFIRQTRKEHYRLSKWKIKPLLDEFCLRNNIKTIAIATIGKIIRRYNLFFQPSGRIYHDPNGKQVKNISYKSRVKRSPKEKTPGYYEIDTILRLKNAVKVYIFNAVDINTRFQFSYAYKTGTSLNAKDFLLKLETVSPFKITKVQTDNGSEFQGEFAAYLKKRNLEQVYIYPRCPKINGYVERANRSLSEEFLVSNFWPHGDFNLGDFNAKLIEHLIWFNSKRVHRSLNNLSPLDFWIKNSEKSHMCVAHTFN
jgi:preprotein translocase subunit Sss1